MPLVGDARETIKELDGLLASYTVPAAYASLVKKYNGDWNDSVDKIYSLRHGQPASQGEVIGAVTDFSSEKDIVLCAAGSLPGDLHKLWRTQDSKGFHLEYGYSCMGYEIAGGLGAKNGRPVPRSVRDGGRRQLPDDGAGDRDLCAGRIKLTIVLLNNNGYASIGGLSESLGTGGFGTEYRYRDQKSGQLAGGFLPVDLAANAESLGAVVLRTKTIAELKAALAEAKATDRTTVIYIETDRSQRVGGYAWWEVPVAQVSTQASVKESLDKQLNNKKKQRYYL